MKLWTAKITRPSPADGEDRNCCSSVLPKLPAPAVIFWVFLHSLCCLVSLLLGFRFSRILFFILFSSPAAKFAVPAFTAAADPSIVTISDNLTAASSVVAGRHGIPVRPWPHPDPAEVNRAHRIIERVQQEQRRLAGRQRRPVIAVTPTYVRTFQALHLAGVMHTFALLPDYVLTWIVVEAVGSAGAGASDETRGIISGAAAAAVLHVAYREEVPDEWEERRRMESRMRLHALRIVRERRMDGIVVFADESNWHSVELFDEIQSVKWIGELAIGFLPANPGKVAGGVAAPLPIQGTSCNSSGEWAGFAVNSRLLWKDGAEGKRPNWVRDLDDVAIAGVKSPLDLLLDRSFVEPLGDCGRKKKKKEVLVWWFRAEARSDSKFPPGWKLGAPPAASYAAWRPSSTSRG